MSITYKNYTDSRDGTVYPCVQMPDGKWWFTKNLSYASANSHVYNNDSANEAIYGRLYPWDDLASACPPGCHIPTDAEWTALTTAIGEDVAGTKLKASSALWITNTGTDDYGFSALPAGYRDYDETFYCLGDYATFWSSSEYDASNVLGRYLGGDGAGVSSGCYYKTTGFSLRCIVDEAPAPLDPPTAIPPSGMYSKYQVISLESVTEGAVVYYTVDGSTPSASSSTAPMVLLKAFTLKAIAIKDGQSSEIATFEYSIVPWINPSPDSESGERRFPDDGVSLQMILESKSFSPTTGRIRKNLSIGDPVFSSSFAYTYDTEELPNVLRMYMDNPTGYFEYPVFPIGLSKIDAYITGQYKIAPLERGATLIFPVKAILDLPTSKLPEITLSSGELPVCPFPIAANSDLSKVSTDTILSIDDPYSAQLIERSIGTTISLTASMSLDMLSQFIAWWWKTTDCGRKKFITSIFDTQGCSLTLTGKIEFSVANCLGQIKLSGLVVDLQRITSVSQVSGWKGHSQPISGIFSSNSVSVAFSSDGVLVAQSDWHFNFASSTTGTIYMGENLPNDTYTWCVYGGGKISNWNTTKITDSQ
jgi:uncharacterized protein (TIGR02145 family)